MLILLFAPMASDGVLDNCHSKAEEIKDSKEHRDSDIGVAIKPCNKKNYD